VGGYNYFRLHPKGRGVVAKRQGGIPPFTLVDEYIGQLHSGELGRGGLGWIGIGDGGVGVWGLEGQSNERRL